MIWATQSLHCHGARIPYSHVQGHLAAQKLLSRLLGEMVHVGHNVSGVPYIIEYPSLHVSISHCRQAVAVAVCTNTPIGIDVEARRRVSGLVVERVCTAHEQRLIAQSSDPTMCFLQLWTRKEAILKCKGTGIQGVTSLLYVGQTQGYMSHDISCGLPDVVASLAIPIPAESETLHLE